MNKKTSLYLKKFNDILSRYRSGEFGDNHLTLREILIKANEEEIFDEMSSTDIQYLINHSMGVTKWMYSELQKEKISEEKKLTLKK